MLHDDYFKKSLEKPEVAKEFLETHLPKEVKKIVNISSFKVAKESFIDEKLKKKFVDVLFENKKNEYILILAEHQSTPDHFMAFRFVKYICNIWDRHINNNPHTKKLPFVYSLVFCNSPKSFDPPRSIWDLVKNKDLAEKFLFKLQLVDTKDMSDSFLKTRPYAGFMQFFMKHIYSENMIKIWEKAAEIFSLKKLKRDYLKSTLWYTIGRIDENDQDQLYKILNKATTEGESLMTSLAQKWKNEGIEEGKLAGIQEGIEKGKAAGIQEERLIVAKNMLAKGYLSKEIANMTGLTIQEVENLRKN